MAVPLEDYKPVDLGAGRNPIFNRKLEKYGWLISMAAFVYRFMGFPYSRAAGVVVLISSLAVVAAIIIRYVRARRLTHQQ